jgi:hypothetical protein
MGRLAHATSRLYVLSAFVRVSNRVSQLTSAGLQTAQSREPIIEVLRLASPYRPSDGMPPSVISRNRDAGAGLPNSSVGRFRTGQSVTIAGREYPGLANPAFPGDAELPEPSSGFIEPSSLVPPLSNPFDSAAVSADLPLVGQVFDAMIVDRRERHDFAGSAFVYPNGHPQRAQPIDRRVFAREKPVKMVRAIRSVVSQKNDAP